MTADMCRTAGAEQGEIELLDLA
eukprot:SAG31_NODE_37222_length_306_cov_0.743961_1_plen_22_part_01